MPGRPRKPTRTKVLQGTFRKDRSNAREPEPAELSGDTPPPASLCGVEAKARWVGLAPMLAEMGVFTVADAPALEMLCRLLGQADALDAAKLPVPGALAAEVRMHLVQFGMTPSGRARVSKVDRKPESKLQRFTEGSA